MDYEIGGLRLIIDGQKKLMKDMLDCILLLEKRVEEVERKLTELSDTRKHKILKACPHCEGKGSIPRMELQTGVYSNICPCCKGAAFIPEDFDYKSWVLWHPPGPTL